MIPSIVSNSAPTAHMYHNTFSIFSFIIIGHLIKKAAHCCAATLDVVAWLLDAQLLTNVDHVGILDVVQLADGLHSGVVLFSKRT